MNEEKLGTGAIPSKKDKRNIKYKDISMAVAPLVTGGIHYLPEDIEHQHQVGICTAISRVQMRQKQTGKKYSPEFQYLLQKKFIDKNWIEGSSPLSSNKVAKTYGFLPIEEWTYTTEADRYLPYSQYIEKLKAISDDEIDKLIEKCVDKIAGYAQVDVTDPQAIARAIIESPGQTGILCRYGCQKNWWTPSWLAKDIEPLRWAPETSGHQVINSFFDYTNGNMLEIPNTWGTLWARKGLCFVNNKNYPITEAFVDLLFSPMFKFTETMKLGSRSNEVKELQKRLNVIQTGYFWVLTKQAVMKYQKEKGLVVDGIVGPATRLKLNE